MNTVSAYIPIKDHSARLPNKNFLDFNGYPLFYWVIDSLYKTDLIDEIIVNTDSQRFKEQVTKYNFKKLKIIDRPEFLCGDDTSVNKIIAHDLDEIKNDVILQTHVTNPLLSIKTISESINNYFNLDSKFDSIFSVDALYKRGYLDDSPINHNPKELLKTQDLNPILIENSNLYIFSKNSFNNNKQNRVGRNPSMYIMDKKESIDIDDLNDFVVAVEVAKISNANL